MKHPKSYKWPLAIFGLIAAFMVAQMVFTPQAVVNQILIVGLGLVAAAGLVISHRQDATTQPQLAVIIEYGILFLLLLFVGLSVF